MMVRPALMGRAAKVAAPAPDAFSKAMAPTEAVDAGGSPDLAIETADGASVLVQVKAWQDQGRELLKSLEDERDRLRAKLHQVETLIAELPLGGLVRKPVPKLIPAAGTVVKPVPPVFVPPVKTTVDLVIEAVTEAGNSGITALDIQEWLRTRAGRKVAAANIHSYVYKLTKAGKLQAIGNKPYHYVLPTEEVAAVEEDAMSE